MKVIRLNDMFPVQGGPPISRSQAHQIHEKYCFIRGSYEPLSVIEKRGGFTQKEVAIFSLKNMEEIKRAYNWYVETLL